MSSAGTHIRARVIISLLTCLKDISNGNIRKYNKSENRRYLTMLMCQWINDYIVTAYAHVIHTWNRIHENISGTLTSATLCFWEGGGKELENVKVNGWPVSGVRMAGDGVVRNWSWFGNNNNSRKCYYTSSSIDWQFTLWIAIHEGFKGAVKDYLTSTNVFL